MKKFLSFLLGGLLFTSAAFIAQAQPYVSREVLTVEAEFTVGGFDPFSDGYDEFFYVPTGSVGEIPTQLALHTRLNYFEPTATAQTYKIEVRAGATLVATKLVTIPAGTRGPIVPLPLIIVPFGYNSFGDLPDYEVFVRRTDGGFGVAYIYTILP